MHERWKLAVTHGMQALKYAPETYDEDGNGDGGGGGVGPEELEVDIYNSRSLPYVIGTEAWLESEDAGLGMGLADGSDEEDEDDGEEVGAQLAVLFVLLMQLHLQVAVTRVRHYSSFTAFRFAFILFPVMSNT